MRKKALIAQSGETVLAFTSIGYHKHLNLLKVDLNLNLVAFNLLKYCTIKNCFHLFSDDDLLYSFSATSCLHEHVPALPWLHYRKNIWDGIPQVDTYIIHSYIVSHTFGGNIVHFV